MAAKTRRTSIEIETHELTRIRFGPGSISTRCQNCGETVSIQADVVAYGMDVAPADEQRIPETQSESAHRRLLHGLLSATKERKLRKKRRRNNDETE